jgi:pyrimidine deaminase RibD-like protein
MTHDPADLDRHFLRRAVALSKERMEANLGGPFGAVIVRNGEIIAEGWNEVTSALDPTAHAEVTAIRRACQAVGHFSLEGATLYSSCEPCPMCLAATYWARIGRLVYANTRDEAASIGFDDAFLYDEMPRDPLKRALPTDHVALDEARAVFEIWRNKADKIAY